VTAQRRGELGFGDRRRFHLIGYRHGHSQAVVRGLPDPDEEDGGAELWIIDFLFVGVVRSPVGRTLNGSRSGTPRPWR
jgi:hypothetical protein